MWYWDYIPSWGHHSKKPLTKAALKKIQENYKKADEITDKVKKTEAAEIDKNKVDMESAFNLFF